MNASKFWLKSAAIAAAVLVLSAAPAVAQRYESAGDAPGADRAIGGGGHRYRAPLPPEAGAPAGRPFGGASRGGGDLPLCQSLAALVPSTREVGRNGREYTSVWALTAAAHPTFWFYVPYALTSDEPAEFVLFDDQRRIIYRKQDIVLSNQPGIIGISLPETAPALEIGRMYRWNFQTRCGGEVVFVEGWIQRTALDAELTSEIDRASPLDRAALYAENGIWYDALTLLGNLRREDPDNLDVLNAWMELLEVLELGESEEEIVLTPIAPAE
ncbi:DUF928 domain-containing protein [Thermoleptolyngbya sichuanensis A183]|uniref:DUF928 domain-containing protein n=1 Tax=Thermoleptolyngbya sichuanensis A183 TaxID=2737172 RepID=A0A6M8B9U7_9CYAN|nr:MULTISPECIES: DUF928 domain-containing protein [Thermoleptolyngbya]QKD80896.1 DUF928 domain-containing protein [Thermoleptolyngbya sichuanensis A183]